MRHIPPNSELTFRASVTRPDENTPGEPPESQSELLAFGVGGDHCFDNACGQLFCTVQLSTDLILYYFFSDYKDYIYFSFMNLENLETQI